MMEARGFPVGDFDRRYEDLTVDHALVAKHYREGHDIAEKRGDATTEEMRRAINHYEKLFEELVSETEEADATDGTVPGVPLNDADTRDGTSFGDADTVSMTSNGRPIRPD